eukprot:Skav232898  [mRNA]  locus=scaffold1477:189229:190026:- [translate_table: standard]
MWTLTPGSQCVSWAEPSPKPVTVVQGDRYRNKVELSRRMSAKTSIQGEESEEEPEEDEWFQRSFNLAMALGYVKAAKPEGEGVHKANSRISRSAPVMSLRCLAHPL